MAAQQHRLGAQVHLVAPGGEGRKHVVVAEQAVGDRHHVREVAHVRADPAEDADHPLDQERRLDQAAVGEMGEGVKVADIVALELELRAVGLPDLGHDPLDEHVVVVHDPAAAALDVLALPVVLPLRHPLAGARVVEDQRAHVEAAQLGLRGVGAFETRVEAHRRAAAGRDVDHRVGALLDPRQERHEVGGLRARAAVGRDAGVKVTISSDDPPFFHTSLKREYELASEAFGFSDAEIDAMTRTGIEAAFVDEETRKALFARL